jgi:D-alanyl-D-alanine carboxypeptidase
MLRSGNDAALAIANYVGGDVNNFVTMMNAKAKEIGMIESTFNNPHGLDNPKGNYSSAYDMAILTSYAMSNEMYRKIVGTKSYSVKTNLNYYIWVNKNKLLNMYKYTTGGKTGFTEVAKRTLVTTASKDNLNLVVVTLNDGNDFNDHIALFDEAFSNYTNYQILTKDYIDILGEDYYQDGYFYLEHNYHYPLLETEKNSIILKFELDKKEGYKSGDKVGKVKVYIGDKEVHQDDVYLKLRKEITWWGRVKMWFKNLW